jgi:hypothetical protein
MQDGLSDLCRITRLMSPIRCESSNQSADRRLILRQKNRDIRNRAIAPVGPHATRFQSAYLYSEGRNLQSNGFGEAAYGPFRGMIGGTSRGRKPAADR